MDNGKKLNTTQIFYFPLEEKTVNFCQLKLLTNFVKFNYKVPVLKFSYIDSEGSLLGNLSLKENIELSSDKTDIDSFSNFEIEQILENFGNYYLTELYKKVDQSEKETKDKESVKIASLVKSFFRSGPYYFYHSPEKFLTKENLNLFIKALEIQSLTSHQTILIASENQGIWNQLATHLVKRDHNKKFQVLPIIRKAENGLIVKKLTKPSINNDSDLIIKNIDYKKAS